MRNKSFRIYHQQNKLKNRCRLNYYPNTHKTLIDFIKDVKDGKTHQHLKHTSRPCSCFFCKKERYSKKDRIKNKAESEKLIE